MTTAQIKHVGFTLPSPMEREFHKTATEEHRTKSELFREMFRVYRSYRKRQPEPEIDDTWVMQVIAEAQEEERRSPTTPDQRVAEFRELARYGAEQANKVGIDVEDPEVINRLVHEERARWREKNRASSRYPKYYQRRPSRQSHHCLRARRQCEPHRLSRPRSPATENIRWDRHNQSH
jgi:hypothetical protein